MLLNRLPRVIAGAMVIVAMATLSACSGGDTGTDSGGGNNNQMSKVSVGIFPSSMNAVFQYGVDTGVFKAHGIEVQTIMGQSGAAALPALSSGTMDFAVSSTLTPLVSQTQGIKLPIVSGFTQDNPDIVEDTAVVVVGKQSPIVSVCDLKGKTVAVNALSNIGDMSIAEAFEQSKCGDPSSIKFVQLGFQDVAAQLASGQIDAGMTVSPFIQQIVGDGGKIVLDFIKQIGVGKQELSIIASPKMTGEKPGVVRKFIAALSEACAKANKNPDAVRASMLKGLGVTPEQAKQAVFELWSTDINRKAVQRWADLALKHGLVTKKPDVDAVLWKG
jgi:NitT/TauT family transport system substrate-binding protein